MSNLGLNKYARDNGLELLQTQVGDRYVLEEMLKDGFNLGGEQSGHVILLDYNPTGDGILTSLMLIKSILEEGKKASELGETVKKLIKEGMSEEKIIEEVLKDKVMERFEYLKSINPDTSVFVRNWVEDAIKKKNKREKQERER